MVLIDDDPYFLMTWSNGNETYQRLEGDDLDYFLDNQVLQCVQKRIDPEEREHSLEEQKRKEERSTAEENKNVEDEARRKFNSSLPRTSLAAISGGNGNKLNATGTTLGTLSRSPRTCRT